MNPWNILGWILATFFGLILISFVAFLIYFFRETFWRPWKYYLQCWLKHWQTKSTAPQKGQYWENYYGSWVEIVDVDLSNVYFRIANAHWVEVENDLHLYRQCVDSHYSRRCRVLPH